jgi:hypothetical protein
MGFEYEHGFDELVQLVAILRMREMEACAIIRCGLIPMNCSPLMLLIGLWTRGKYCHQLTQPGSVFKLWHAADLFFSLRSWMNTTPRPTSSR